MTEAGCHDLWINEYTIPLRRPTRDGRRHHGVPRREGRSRADLLRRTVGPAGLARPMGRAVRPAAARGLLLADRGLRARDRVVVVVRKSRGDLIDLVVELVVDDQPVDVPILLRAPSIEIVGDEE